MCDFQSRKLGRASPSSVRRAAGSATCGQLGHTDQMLPPGRRLRGPAPRSPHLPGPLASSSQNGRQKIHSKSPPKSQRERPNTASTRNPPPQSRKIQWCRLSPGVLVTTDSSPGPRGQGVKFPPRELQGHIQTPATLKWS